VGADDGEDVENDEIRVNVANVNPSAAIPAGQTADEGVSESFELGSFTDPGPDGPWNVTVAWGDGSQNDTFTANAPGSLGSLDHTYPDGDETYTATVTVAEAGDSAPSGSNTFEVEVDNVAPTANAQNVSASEGVATTVTLTGDDVDADKPLSFLITSLPENGTLFDGEDENAEEIAATTEADPFELSSEKVSYIPDDGFAGDDGFDFVASDGAARSAAARVGIAVVSASPDTTTIEAAPEEIVADGTSTAEITVKLKDADGNEISRGTGYTVELSTTSGTLSNVTNNNDGTFTATLTAPTTVGTATISGALTGGGMTDAPISDDAEVRFVPGPLDGFSVEKAGGGAIGPQLAGTPFDARVTAIDANDNTVESFIGTVGFTSTPSGGISAGATSGTFTNGVLASHSITFGTPGSFTLTATGDGESGTSNEFAVEAPPTAVNDGPTANSAPGDPYHTPFDNEFVLSAPRVMSNDTRGFPEATVVSFGGGDLGGDVTSRAAGDAVSLDDGGSLTVNGNGSVNFTPPDGFTGEFEFQYRISNTRGTSDAIVRIAVGERPSATNDTYSTTLLGNVPIDTATASNFSVSGNDRGSEPELDVVSQSNGSATIRDNGTFAFTPNAGHEGSASFTYTVKNGFGTSDAATVSMTVSKPVWFVNAGVGTNGNGTFGSPFNCLVGTGCFDAAASDDAGDRIFLRSGSYTGGLTLLNDQRLVGQGASGTFDSATGLTWPADSGARPSVGGASPTITTSAANANGVNLGSGNTLVGFDVGNTTGSGINGSGFGTLNVGNVGISGSGQALNLTNGTLAGSLSGVTSTSGTNNVSLSGVGTGIGGTFGLGSGVLSGASGDAFRVSSGNGSFTYGGSVANTNSLAANIENKTGGTVTLSGAINPNTAARGIRASGNGGGTTIEFSGSNKKISSVSGTPGVNLMNNGNSTIAFTNGGLDISGSGSSPGMSATGGGTVRVGGSNNAISTGGGAALIVQNTNIGSGGLAFRSISANGGANGIVLDNTGNTAGLTVAGNGGTCSSAATCTGGAIQNISSDGVSLTNTRSPSFDNFLVKDTGRHGIYGTGVVDFTFKNSRIEGAGDGNGEDGISFATLQRNNLSGAALVQNSTITGSAENNMYIESASGSLNLTVDNSDFADTLAGDFGEDGLLVVANGSAQTKARVHNGSTFTNLDSVGVSGISDGNATLDFTVEGNTFTGAQNADGTLNNASDNAVEFTSAAQSTLRFAIKNNTMIDHPNTAIDLGANQTSRFDGTITGNTIGDGSPASGSQRGNGIAFAADDDSTAVAKIDDNDISGIETSGIDVLANEGFESSPTPEAHVAITNNTISTPRDTERIEYNTIFMQAQNNGKICANVRGNAAAAGSGPFYGSESKFSKAIHASQFIDGNIGGANPDFRIERLNGASVDEATVVSHLASENPASASTAASIDPPGSSPFTGVPGGTCLTPTEPTLP
jgi:hypothetical protein